jgi:hypothetical protein
LPVDLDTEEVAVVVAEGVAERRRAAAELVIDVRNVRAEPDLDGQVLR